MQIYNAYTMIIAATGTLELRAKYEQDHKKGYDSRFQIPLHHLRAICDEVYVHTGLKFDIVQSSRRSDEIFDVYYTRDNTRVLKWSGLRREGALCAISYWVEYPYDIAHNPPWCYGTNGELPTQDYPANHP